MSWYKLLTLEQSILGSGEKMVKDVQPEQLIEWAKLDAPRNVPSFAWRTELAIVRIHEYYLWAAHQPFMQEVVTALGYYSTVFTTAHIVKSGMAASRCHKKQQREGHIHCYKVASGLSGIVWSWDPVYRHTKGLVYSMDARQSFLEGKKLMLVAFSLSRCSQLRANPFLLGLLMLKAEMKSVEDQLKFYAMSLSMAQVKTGRHSYPDHERKLAAQDLDLLTLSADVSGIATSLSYEMTRLQGLQKSLDYIGKQCRALQEQEFDSLANKAILRSLPSSKAQITSMLEILKSEANYSLDEARRQQWISEIILQTVFTMTNQRDQELSLQLARDSKTLTEHSVQLAHDSKTLAEDTKTLAEKATRDSNSMKAIAAVTMFFLPGTFVAVSTYT